MELLALYHELMEFKHEPDFHEFCFSENGPYADWAERESINRSNVTDDSFQRTGLSPGDIRQMGIEYCFSGGQETTTTRWTREQMEPHWLASLPSPTVYAIPTQTPHPTPTPIPSWAKDEFGIPKDLDAGLDAELRESCKVFHDGAVIARDAGMSYDEMVLLLMTQGYTTERIVAMTEMCAEILTGH